MKVLSGLISILLLLYLVNLFLLPFLSYAVFYIRRRFSQSNLLLEAWRSYCPAPMQTQPLLEILVPAHNEEKDLPRTLQSIRESLKKANLVARIVVAADSCSDRTAAVALAMGVEVHSVSFASKWKALGFFS